MNDTIVAIATPPGRGGVGIVRISGPKSSEVCKEIIGCLPPARTAHFAPFLNKNKTKIDEGLTIFFKNPGSFTGEDVLELQGHGGPVIMDMLLRRVLSLGVRLARPGEFSERAFLNNKLDLVQAEAVAQLINANTEQAAVAAMRSLQGDFSKIIMQLVESLIRLRLYVEAAIDFPEEEINFLADAHVINSINMLLHQLQTISQQAKQGVILAEGVDVVIAGRPNAGKSTLLNKLTGQDTAIVTPIAGTTRDIVKAQINLDGIMLNIIDTAGLRATSDIVEQAGISRALQAAELADLVLLVADGTTEKNFSPWILCPDLMKNLHPNTKLIVVCNKIDQTTIEPNTQDYENFTIVNVSANTGAGFDLLRSQIKLKISSNMAEDSGIYLARRRHLDALSRAQEHVLNGKKQLEENSAGELLAEDLKHAQLALSEITGEFTSDDLLGRIFSEFCIGK